MSNRFICKFDGFDDLIETLDACNGDLKGVVNECLEKTHELVTIQADAAIKEHHKSGDTERSLLTSPKVEWKGNEAETEVGFKIREGGLASIFLMYGTPKMKKDQALYNAFYGAKTKKSIAKIQERLLMGAIDLVQRAK